MGFVECSKSDFGGCIMAPPPKESLLLEPPVEFLGSFFALWGLDGLGLEPNSTSCSVII